MAGERAAPHLRPAWPLHREVPQEALVLPLLLLSLDPTALRPLPFSAARGMVRVRVRARVSWCASSLAAPALSLDPTALFPLPQPQPNPSPIPKPHPRPEQGAASARRDAGWSHAAQPDAAHTRAVDGRGHGCSAGWRRWPGVRARSDWAGVGGQPGRTCRGWPRLEAALRPVPHPTPELGLARMGHAPRPEGRWLPPDAFPRCHVMPCHLATLPPSHLATQARWSPTLG